MKPELLIFTNGFEGTWPSIEYAAWLAQAMQVTLTLVGVLEPNDSEHPVQDMFSRAVSLFQEKGITYLLEVEKGTIEDAIKKRKHLLVPQPAPAARSAFLVVGPFGRPQVRRFLIGNSFRWIMGAVNVPVLFVPQVRLPIKRVLVCIGGLGFTPTAEHPGIKIALMNHAALTFLTVVPPGDLEYPEAKKIRENWKNLAETDTLQGRTLREAHTAATNAGLNTSIIVRNGNIEEQILAEIKTGNYDLVCMGSQFSSSTLRQVYTPNITADVAEVSQTPILCARNF